MTVDSRTHLPDGTTTTPHYISIPSADVMTPAGIGTQALMGQRFDVIDEKEGQFRGVLRSILPGVDRVDYIGKLPSSALSRGALEPTHRVSAVVAAVFEKADIKSKLIESLPRNSVVQGQEQGDFLKLSQDGYVHLRHLVRSSQPSSRPFMDIAADMLGLPYIWGGTGYIGVDCSGLVQSALAAIGEDAPRDTVQQENALGGAIEFADRRLGDLLFWPGHVGIVVDGDQLLHANAHHMSVAREPVEQAVARIGEVRTVKRLSTFQRA